MDIYTIIILLHVAGTILGVGGATIAEVSIHKALKDGTVSVDEKALLHGTYTVLRVGMGLIILSAVLMIWYHTANDTIRILLSDRILFKGLLFTVIVCNAVAISKHWVPLWLGAGISFTSWWMAAGLGVIGYVPYSFITYLVIFLIATPIITLILHLLRNHHKF